MGTYYRRLVRFLGTKTFFGLILAIFLFSAMWIAVSARYPMAFDEKYHLGLIKLHALQWNPIFTHQPVGVAEYGALTRDPSYLYHWLMSFPYRLLQASHVGELQTIIVLRYINILLFTASLVLYRELLLKTKASPALVHAILLFFVLIPVVPFLAATINYDNLQILLLAMALLLLVRFRERLLRKKFDVSAFVYVCSIGLLGSLVKFTFLPFLTAFALYFIYGYIRNHRAAGKAMKKSWRATSTLKKVLLSASFLLSVGLFLTTYGVNIAKYHNPVPQCGQVLNYQTCAAYSPWNRNYHYALENTGVNPNPVLYSGQWIGGMFDRLFFVINGNAPVDNYQNFLAPFLALAVVVLGVVGFLLSCWYGWRLLRADGVLALLLFIGLFYTISVWGRNYHDYLHLGHAVAINGRYLVPILPPFILLFAKSYQQFLANRVKAKALLFSLSLLLFLQGGGVSSFIFYSSDAWYFENDATAKNINHAAKRVITPFFVTRYLTALDHLYQ